MGMGPMTAITDTAAFLAAVSDERQRVSQGILAIDSGTTYHSTAVTYRVRLAVALGTASAQTFGDVG